MVNLTAEQVFELHKPIRNRIREFAPVSLINRAVSTLHERIDTRPPGEWGGYLPWTLLLIIRWTFLYAEQGTRIATQTDLDALHRQVQNLDDAFALPNQGDRDAVSAFMGRTLFTQLPYQRSDYELRGIGRQLVMFEDFGRAFGLDEAFQDLYGLSIREFMRLYYACWSGKPDIFSVEYFHGMFPEPTIKVFFNCLSVDLLGGKQFVRDFTKPGASIQFQLYEPSPLRLKPFFRLGHRWSAFSFRLMTSSLLDSLYDLLREDMPGFTAKVFGPLFERYLGGTIAYYADGQYETEADLKARLPRDSKAVDFLIEDDTSAIFVEAKGTELHVRAQVFQSRDTILMNTRSTTLKAVVQCQETACKLVRAGAFEGKNLFGLIVTYRDYLFGEGSHFWEDVIGDNVTAQLQASGLEPVIPPQNLFFISVADFDWLVAGAKQRGVSLSEVLLQVIERNKDSSTRALMLQQHLEKMWQIHYEPPALEAAREGFQAEVMEIAKVLLKPGRSYLAWKRKLMNTFRRFPR